MLNRCLAHRPPPGGRNADPRVRESFRNLAPSCLVSVALPLHVLVMGGRVLMPLARWEASARAVRRERVSRWKVLEDVREVATLEVNGYIDVDGTSGSTRLNRSLFPMTSLACLVTSLAVFPARDHIFPCLERSGCLLPSTSSTSEGRPSGRNGS